MTTMMADQAQALRRLASETMGRPAQVVAVTSGKGGVGKSNVALNLAVRLSAMGRRVLLIDADLGTANVDVLCNLAPHWTLAHVVAGRCSLEQATIDAPGGFRLIPGASGLAQIAALSEFERARLIQQIRQLEHQFDVLLIDTGAGIGDNVLFFVGGAQEAVLVVTPEPTSLTDAYAAVKVLSLEGGVEHFNVLVNPAPSEQAAREIYEKLCNVTRRFLKARLKLLGFIPRDENLQRAVLMQKPVVQAFPQAPVSRALKVIADKLISEPPPASSVGGLKFLWNRLLRESPEAPPVAPQAM